MPTIEDYEHEIEQAEQAVEQHEDRLPIIDTMEFGCIHGYVEPGKEPVGYTDPLQQTLDELVSEDGSITGMFPIENENRSYSLRTHSPEDNEYIALLDDLLTNYTIPGDREPILTA